MRFIGITGGVGAGKSKLLSYIRKHYLCEVYLADEVAHLVKRKGTVCHDRLVELLGEEILDSDGEIDNAAMAERIFQDAALLKQINAIVHPAVREYLVDRLAKARENADVELFFVEAALLIEAGYGELVDELWYVYADEEVRRKRLAAGRGYGPEKIANIMSHQLSDERFRANCDFVIDNGGKLEDGYRQIDKKLEDFSWRE